ncbi:hypothetical protein AX15_003134 [Amanita polypyramis BW_CC]|nr:hypothetical protein AX15_003134 [Amanita polypyramis BW_CC]
MFAQQPGATTTTTTTTTTKSAAEIKPCNTPTSASVASSWNRVSPMEDMEYQDEQMVEELLIPCAQTPVQAQANAYPHAPLSHQPSGSSEAYYTHQSSENYRTLSHSHIQATSTSSDHSPAFDPSVCSSPSSPSLFTSTDPFYIAQLQEMQMQVQTRHGAWSGYEGQPHNRNSFARLGKPDEASPFLRGAQTQAQVQASQQYQQQQQQQRWEQAQVQTQHSDFLHQLQMYHQFYPTTAVGS